jgi:hypothetical protein
LTGEVADRIYENAAECPVLWTRMNAAFLRFGRQDILILHCIFDEAGKPRLSMNSRPVGGELHLKGIPVRERNRIAPC